MKHRRGRGHAGPRIWLLGLLLFAVGNAQSAVLDIDGNESADALTDGLLVIRYLFGFKGDTLIADAVDTVNCSRCTAEQILNYLELLDSGQVPVVLDVDGNGATDALTDGLLVIRYLFGFRQNTLIEDAVDLVNCTRCDGVEVWSDIQAYLESLVLPALINDTGITLCGDANTNDLPCPVTGFPGQDAQYGRDVTHNDPSDGHAGFSFTKLDADGLDLLASAPVWSCVRDNHTGRVWEVKTDDDGLQDRDNTYTWYNPDSGSNGGSSGTQNGGDCTGVACDTSSYADAVNAQELCGDGDWRVPDRRDLMSIAINDGRDPAVDTRYFPQTQSGPDALYWSASASVSGQIFAWYVNFNDGDVFIDRKDIGRYVRLVRGGQ